MHSRQHDIIRYPESAKRLIKKGMFNEVKSVMPEKDFFAPIRCRDLKQLHSFFQ